jgi:O-antigen ligase
MKTYDLKLFQFFFLILPFALVKGLNFPNIIITAIVIYYIFKNFQKIFDIPFYFKVFFLFIFYLIFISLIGETKIFSLHTSISYLRYGLFILAIPYILDQKKLLKIFFYILSILFLILFLDLFFQFIYKKNIFGMLNVNSERISGMFGRRQVAGSYVLRFMPVILFLSSMFIKKDSLYKYLLIIISLGIILLSGERTALFLFLLFLTFIILVKKNFNFLISMIFIGIASFTIFFYFMPIQKKRFFNDTVNQFSIKDDVKKYYIFSERHQYHYLTSLNMFKANLLFGSGPNSFRYLCDTPKYSVEKIILENNTVRTKFAGKVILDKENIYVNEKKAYRYFDTDIDIKASLINKNGEVIEIITIPQRSKIFILNNSDVKSGDALFVKFIEYKNGCNTHPHNFLIQILGETGFFGFLFYLYFLYKIIWFIVKNLYFLYFENQRLKSEKYMYLAGACLINFFPFTASGNFFNSWLCIIFCIPFGLLYYLDKNKIS